MAIAGLGVAQRAGFGVPADLSITGFDGTEIGEHLYPSLTHGRDRCRELGRAAARTLLAVIAAAPMAHDRSISTSRRRPSCVRESTGPVPQHEQ